jgi:ABC-type nitrate/sulfonate/bicarbonate transport system substrate-binding protein
MKISLIRFAALFVLAALGLPYQATSVATTRKFIRERTDVVRRYIKAHVEAVHRFKTDRETSMKVLAKSLALSDKQLHPRFFHWIAV